MSCILTLDYSQLAETILDQDLVDYTLVLVKQKTCTIDIPGIQKVIISDRSGIETFWPSEVINAEL